MPPLHAHPRLHHRDSATPTGGFTTIDAPPRRVAGVSQPYGRNSPHAPDEPKVACNSGARTFYSTPKRCNSNDVMSNLEIHAGELHATFLRNHNMRHHKGPKQKTAQAQKTPTARGERRSPHSFPAAPTGDFTTIDAPPRRVAGVSQPYGRNSPHAPTHNRQPRTHSRPSHDRTQPPTHTNRGFYYHRHPTTACRRRVAALWSQFPPRPHPQPPTTPPTAGPATHPQQAQPRAHPQPPATASSMGFSRHEPPVATAHASRRAPPRSMGAWPPWRHWLPLRHPQTRRAPTLVSCMIRRCPRWSTET